MQRFIQNSAPAKLLNQIVVGHTRISVISPKIVRVEKSANGFTDKRTQAVFCRDYCDKKADISLKNNKVTIEIEDRKYIIDTKSLKYEVYIDSKKVRVNNKENLKGTIRTLDGDAGFSVLPNGLMSKSGLTILDDSKSVLFNEDGTVSKRDDGYIDFYILAFGRDYLSGLTDFYNLSGKTPVVPKYALGNWWSRYHAYTQEEYLNLMDEFSEKDIPFTVSTVDMDWHLVEDVPDDVPNSPRFPKGWTGYTFNKKLFPDYKKFLKELHERNLKVALNLHPKDGVRYFEEQYPEMARLNGIDPNSREPVEFDLLDQKFIKSYFDVLHHPYERDGVDIWWIDWQQGTKSKMSGVDPLLLLNHYHYLDINRDKKDGIILSRYAGIGSHRYPLGFSGDTVVCWKSLDFQPYFTLCSANVGYTWWSHDIGGHMFNRGDNELYLRWLQLGCFLPINRLHSTNNTLSKEPWLYKDAEKDAIEFLRLRHSLIPYCYSASIKNNTDSVPICSPLYYFYDDERAYEKRFKNQFIFASNLLVCPITKPKKKKKDSELTVFFPEGEWVNIFNYKKYKGNRIQKISCPLNEYPVFIKEGNFIPLLKRNKNEIDYTCLLVKVFLGDGSYELLDNDGKITFSVKKTDYNYEITAEKTGSIDTKEIEFEFAGTKIPNKKVELKDKITFTI